MRVTYAPNTKQLLRIINPFLHQKPNLSNSGKENALFCMQSVVNLIGMMSMDIEYIKENYIFETLNENHDLDDFECESEDLTNFLKNDALNQQDLNLSLTHLVICEGVIVGYVSILTDSMKLKILEDETVKKEIRAELNITENNEMPAIKIGRFAIDKEYAHKGLGKHVFRNVLLSILDISQNIVGLRFITVDAYASAFWFYVDKNNFKYRKNDQKLVDNMDEIIKIDSERSFSLYKDLKSI